MPVPGCLCGVHAGKYLLELGEEARKRDREEAIKTHWQQLSTTVQTLNTSLDNYQVSVKIISQTNCAFTEDNTFRVGNGQPFHSTDETIKPCPCQAWIHINAVRIFSVLPI